MPDERDEEILALIGRLKAELYVARKHSLDDTVRLLEMATLNLQCVVHSISDDELRQFSEMLRDNDPSEEGEHRPQLNG
jgi:hypothetical protein